MSRARMEMAFTGSSALSMSLEGLLGRPRLRTLDRSRSPRFGAFVVFDES